jgi:hypothetical protein
MTILTINMRHITMDAAPSCVPRHEGIDNALHPEYIGNTTVKRINVGLSADTF